jgi:hypothetical protein
MSLNFLEQNSSQSSAAHPGAHPSSRTFKLATIIHKNVSRHRSPPPVTAASRRSMSNISFSLINQSLVVSSSNGRDRSPARLMKKGEFET